MGENQLFYSLFPLPVLFSLTAAGIALVGDKVVGIIDDRNRWQRALADNATHALIALLSWAAVIDFGLNKKDIGSSILCSALGSLLDVDHFIAAQSSKLEDALNLHHRPPFHATSLILFVAVVVFCVQKLTRRLYKFLPLLVIVAGLSHHIRDGTRRGLWFPPFGSTPPIPYWMYIGCVAALPLVLRLLLCYFSARNASGVEMAIV